MDKTFLLTGAAAGFLAVALGAFGAHGLRARLSPSGGNATVVARL